MRNGLSSSDLQQWVEGLVAQVEADTSVQEAHAHYQAAATNLLGLNKAWMASGMVSGSAEDLTRREVLRTMDEAWRTYEFAKLTRFGEVSGIRQALNAMWCLTEDTQARKTLRDGLIRLEAM